MIAFDHLFYKSPRYFVSDATINKEKSRNVTCDFGPSRKWTNKEKLY